jgi:type I restriction-modification system DNA methylase subunit
MPRSAKSAPAPKKHASVQSLNGAVKSICDIMRRSNCAGALQYVPELTWILFLRILDEREAREAEEAEALGLSFTPALTEPHRWRDWADPACPRRQDKHWSAWKFLHEQLLPHLKTLKDQPGATPRQKVISEIMCSVDRSRIDAEKNFLDVLDKVHELSADTVDDTHVFTLSQVYEGLLLKMGEKGNGGGQFFTPREVIRLMVRVVDPKIGQTVYDPGCGTGGFLTAGPDSKKREKALASAEDAWKSKQREAREAAAKAEVIEIAVYDLKAVNPNRTVSEDRRTPAQLLEEIAAHGQAVDAALMKLAAVA